ncbi:MAG TPA: hypothetical protein VFW75_13845 [Acetobacteraceae bacterium]|nr:hypothetical protein [Acetobacteraceae bacterium]
MSDAPLSAVLSAIEALAARLDRLQTGTAMNGPPSSDVVEGVIASLRSQ